MEVDASNKDGGIQRSYHFAIQWNDLSYKVRNGFIARQMTAITGQNNYTAEKQIIKNVKGTIKSGQLTAIMGPSGAGKSTLLECIAGVRQRGRSGQVKFHGNTNKINLSFIPQQDAFLGVLTVKELLLFASKLQNSTLAKNEYDYMAYTSFENSSKTTLRRCKTISDSGFHEDVANSIMSLLGLEEVANIAAKNISGGQKKRLSIAQELVSKPNILILDEPTSGLDSSVSLQCIQLLQSLTQQTLPMAIVCTIHQPNPKTFALFHKVIILSVIGKCIYEGPPQDIVDELKKVDIDCPIFYNPADFMIEVASGEHGLEAVEKLVNINDLTPLESMVIFPSSFSLKKVTEQPAFPNFSHFCYLFHRSLLLIIRNPLLFALRFGSHLCLAVFIGYLYGQVGKASGCPPDFGTGFSIEAMNDTRRKTIREGKNLLDNLALLFFGLAILEFSSLMPTLITFPLEVKVFMKERRNHWYDIGSYFWGMLLADTPFQLFFTTCFACILYLMTGQIAVMWRFQACLVTFILVALICQCQGLLVGTIFMNNIFAAVYVGLSAFLPIFLFSGFFVKIQTMPEILRPVTYLSYHRFCFEAVIISIYGFERCGDDVQERIESMRRLLIGWFGRMISIVHQVLHGEEEYNDYGQKSSINDTMSIADDSDDMSSMSTVLVDAVMAGVGAGERDKQGNIISGVMSLFDLNDNDLYHCYNILIIYVIALRIASYCLLRMRANAKD